MYAGTPVICVASGGPLEVLQVVSTSVNTSICISIIFTFISYTFIYLQLIHLLLAYCESNSPTSLISFMFLTSLFLLLLQTVLHTETGFLCKQDPTEFAGAMLKIMAG